MTKSEIRKIQNKAAIEWHKNPSVREHTKQIMDTAKRLSNRRNNLTLEVRFKIAERYHRIYGFQE